MAGPGGPGGPGGIGRVLVASDGKAILVKHTTTTSGSTTTTSTALEAVSTAGAVAWTWTPPAGIREIVLPNGLVVVSTATAATTTTAASAQLVGLNLGSGAQAWSTSIDGMLNDLQVTPTGLLGIVSKTVAATGSATQATVTRSLVAFNLSGGIVWSLALD